MGISLLGYGKYSMLTVRAVIHDCERINYFDDICDEMATEAYYLGIPYGLNKKSVKGVFVPSEVKKDLTSVLKSLKKDEKYTVDSYDIATRIENNVIKQNGKLTADEKESLKAYTNQIRKMYQEKMYIPGIEYIAKVIAISDNIALIGIPILLIIAILCTFYLISSRRYVYHGLRYVAYSFLGAGITLLTVFAGCISNAFIYRFNISDVHMRKFFTFWLGHEMLMQAFVGIAFLLTGGVIIYLVFRQKVRAR
jgi:hypothetical protein